MVWEITGWRLTDKQSEYNFAERFGNHMIIGITGGIGAGKTTILNILSEKYGFCVFEADKIGHELMKKDMPAYKKIVKEFGEDILDEKGEIDRQKMSCIVFSDREKLKNLNGIVHPEVIKELKRRIEFEQKGGEDNFVIEAALLIESGCNAICDKVWYIYAEDSVRIERLNKGRGMSQEQVLSVIKNQLKDEEFINKADDMINNSFSIENTHSQIEKLLEF